MRTNIRIIMIIILICAFSYCASEKNNPADLILKNGEIYTMEPDQPWAKAVIITGNKIIEVLKNSSNLDKFIGPNTHIIDLKGKFVMPGYIDSHTHFNEFSNYISDVNLLAVSDDEGLRKELKRVKKFVEAGEWIVGGKWDAHWLWNADWRNRKKMKEKRWQPQRKSIDDITPDNPCFFWSWDKELYLANTAALKIAGLENGKLKGMEKKDGKPTGLIFAGSPAIEKIKTSIKPKSESRILKGMHAGFKVLASKGIVEIHDITPVVYEARYAKIQKKGQLTCRIWMRPDLSRSAEFRSKGIRMNTHPITGKRDYFLRYGAFKGYIDGLMGSHGALLFEPYSDKPNTFGHYRPHSSDDQPGYKKGNLEKMYGLMNIGIEAGFIINTHAIGDKGISICLDLYERLKKAFGLEKIKRSRVIHSQTMRPEFYPRFKALHVIAEVTPSNIEDDMRWIIKRLGPKREKLSHPYKTFFDYGVVTIGGSDIPGAQGATFECHPRSMINAVVNRTKRDGSPQGGWLPEQKISVHEAIKMYTIDAAYAVFDEKIRGSIKSGKLADFTICDLNLLKIDPKDILKMNIEITIVDGKIVYERE